MICTHKETLVQTACALYTKTNNVIIITDGNQGSHCYDGKKLHHAPGHPTTIVNSIGAGDSHIGTIMACKKLGYSYIEYLQITNQVSTKVVASKGSVIPKCEFKNLEISSPNK